MDPAQPIAGAARLAGELEATAKDRRPSGNAKDALAFLGDALTWGEVEVAAALASELLAVLNSSTKTVPAFPAAAPVERGLPRGWLDRLARIAGMYRGAIEDLSRGGRRSLGELEMAARRGRWAWTAMYALARASGNRELSERLQTLVGRLADKSWPLPQGPARSERDLIWVLRPAVAWADLLSRERGERRE